MRKLITAKDFCKMAGANKEVTISSNFILSPSALDLAKQMGVEIIRNDTSKQSLAQEEACTANLASTVAEQECVKQEKAAGSEDTVDQDDLPAIIRKVLAEVLKPACLHPQVTHVQGNRVVMDAFEQAPPEQKVMMNDVVTAREGNLCAGFMSYDHSQMPWKLTYDEVDYVVEGVFTLVVGNKTYTCQAGDVMYIPKNTSVVFGSPKQTKVFYVTYPANWADLPK